MILDWKEYEATAVKAVEEGIVLLENRNGALPLKENTPVAIYGRIQLHYYKSGTGSGGMVSIHAPVRERRYTSEFLIQKRVSVNIPRTLFFPQEILYKLL